MGCGNVIFIWSIRSKLWILWGHLGSCTLIWRQERVLFLPIVKLERNETFSFFILKQFQMNSLNSPPSKKNTTENPTKLSLGVYELPLGVRAGHFSDMSPRQQPAHWHHQSTCWQSSLVNLPTYLILTLFSKGTYTALWTALIQKMVTKISVGKLISGVRELTKSVGKLSYSVSMLVVRVMTCQQSDQ